MRRRLITFFAISSIFLLLGPMANPAVAVPILQLYIEGATYVPEVDPSDPENTGSWVYTGTGPVRLWAIGNVDGDGGKGTISDVKMSVAYQAKDGVSLMLTPTTTLQGDGTYFGGYTDPSTPAAPIYNAALGVVTDGSSPVMGDGASLPSHGVFGAGTYWQEFNLGNFGLTDSPIADFITSFPAAPVTSSGQINVYTVESSGLDPGMFLHFDLYDHVEGKTHLVYKFAPFSHDATSTPVPEPGTMMLLGTGLVGLAGWGRKKFRK